jgi:two-component system chemotaxis sensor kinase CheA
MSGLDTELTDIFHDEATQRLDRMDEVLLAIESGQGDAEAVNSLFRDAHTIKGAAGMLGLDDICTLAHAAEDVLDRARGGRTFPPGLAPPLLRVTDALRRLVAGSADSADSAGSAGPAGSAEPVAELVGELAACRDALPDAGQDADRSEPAPADESPPADASAPADGSAQGDGSAPGDASGPGDASRPGDAHPERPASPARPPPAIRVPAAKVDHLIDVTGEIMQNRHRVEHLMGQQAQLPPDLGDQISGGGRMLDDLMETAVGMRTLPLAAITTRLPRAVRDIAQAAGKQVDFVVSGASTEFDRVIVESLSEPLTHLLRNAVGHGIELPAERERAGKPPRGRVELRAVPRGSMVEIVVADDGRGASPEVMEEARREGSLAGVLTRPGYSTAAEVTELAGRGVGLDAVKEYVIGLGGSLEVRSEPGQGMDVVLLLPLALALTEVLLFERGPGVFGVPLAAVEEVLLVAKTMMLQGQAALAVRGASLPVTDVAALIGAAAPPLGDRSPAILLSVGGRRAIVTCDALLGTEEVVAKSLGLAGAPGYLGAAILGDGRIALLIEPATLTRGSRRTPGPARPEQGPGQKPDPGPAAPPQVLVVEDSFTVRELQRSILEAAGYPVVTARDGRDALVAIRGNPQIALVITDLEMPELDGIELTRAIRADPARSALPVVIVTSYGAEADRRRGIEAGADAYMAKRSFDQQALLATVEQLVGR